MTATTPTPLGPSVEGTTLPPSLTGALVARLTAQVSAAPGAATVTTRAPYTGERLADVPLSSADDVERAYATARDAQAEWAKVPVRERAKVLLRFHDLMLARQGEVLDLMQAESGKTRRDAFLEITDIAMTARYYARSAARMLSPKRRLGAIPVLTHTTELRHPKGVVTVISPWNYPLSMAAGDSMPALVAGNAVVQKPDTQTSLTALWTLDVMREAGLPAGVWQMVVGTPESIGDVLVNSGDFMMFTGSSARGREIAAQAGRRLVGASLELGGKNPMLVLADANIPRTAKGAVGVAFPSAGQLCVSVERMYVVDDIYDEFVDAFVKRTEGLSMGARYDFSIDVGSLTSCKQLDTVTEHVQDAVAKGATVLTGGRARPDIGPLFYEPTILTGVTPEMTAYANETFGPVVSLYRVADVDEAVARANDSEFGLNASVWTRDGLEGRRVASRLRAGTVNVNEGFAAAWASIDAPMGGFGASGLGRRHGIEGLLKYTESQTVAQQRIQGITPPDAIPYPVWAKGLNVVMKTLKAGRFR